MVAQIVTKNDGIQMAMAACLDAGIECPREHARKILLAKNAEGTALRFFYSQPVKKGFTRGGKVALQIVDKHGDFHARFLAALKVMPYTKGTVKHDQVQEPGIVDFGVNMGTEE